MSYKNMMVAPHHLAAKTGSDILKEGGNAIEAIIASAAMISVVYPHMNSMGGDNFWLISDNNKNVHAIDSCGPAASNANLEFYKNQGLSSIPSRGPLSALTVPGAVAGWKLAYDFSVKNLKGSDRPVFSQEDRLFMLRGCKYVDEIIIFDEDTPYNLIKQVRPDIIVKGGDYQKEDIIGKDIVEGKGGRVEIFPFVGNYSTTSLAQKIKGNE